MNTSRAGVDVLMTLHAVVSGEGKDYSKQPYAQGINNVSSAVGNSKTI